MPASWGGCSWSLATFWVLSSPLLHLFSNHFNPLTLDRREKRTERKGGDVIVRLPDDWGVEFLGVSSIFVIRISNFLSLLRAGLLNKP